MPQQPIMLKVLLGQRHWQNYATFCAEYDKAARRIDSDLGQTFPSRAQLHRWLNGALRSLPYAGHCRVLEEMFPGWTAEQLFQPSTPELLYAGGQSGGNGVTARPGTTGPPVFAAPSVGIRPLVEQAFAREHVSIDFAGFSGETLHGVIQEPLDKIRIGRIKPASVTIRMLLPDTTRPMVLPCRADDLADDPDYRDRATRLTARHAHAILDARQRRPRHLRPDENRRRSVPPLRAQRPAHRHPLYRSSTQLVQLHVGHHQLQVPRMTAAPPSGEALDDILARCRYLLLDF
ncbi:MAG TPA: hypothetical protein VMV07_19575, partial [Streptosporangiaceae bacterium]|nr:hypothetical protein [Streptosporangiaceae bacterium]